MSRKRTENAEAKEVVLILKGAASFLSGGDRFVKGIPKKVEDIEMARRLLESGLFEKAGEDE